MTVVARRRRGRCGGKHIEVEAILRCRAQRMAIVEASQRWPRWPQLRTVCAVCGRVPRTTRRPWLLGHGRAPAQISQRRLGVRHPKPFASLPLPLPTKHACARINRHRAWSRARSAGTLVCQGGGARQEPYDQAQGYRRLRHRRPEGHPPRYVCARVLVRPCTGRLLPAASPPAPAAGPILSMQAGEKFHFLLLRQLNSQNCSSCCSGAVRTW
jgi:hypothetical protein